MCNTSGTQCLGLADSAASLVEVPQSNLIASSVIPQSEALFLTLITANFLVPVLMGNLAEDDTLVVHNASQLMATLLSRHARAAGVKLVYTTESQAKAEKRNWVFVDRYLRQSQLKSLLPANVSRCVDFTPLDRPYAHSSSIILGLSPNVDVINTLSMFPSNTKPTSSTRKTGSEVNEILKLAMNSALADLSTWQQDPTASNQIMIGELAEKGYSLDAFSVIEWNSPVLPITVQPAQTKFKPNRSYWLVGLSGDLGLSIADWMIRNGAKILVITSRNPKIDQTWLDSANQRGAVVRILSNDLTEFDSVERTHREICATLSPIAGVFQGAMLLDDVGLRDMKLEQFTRVLRPKVDGSMNLDRLFHDEPLDFFVFFSSAASVAGNPGQANYTAANLFMSGMAEQRRKRGLSASVVDLGLIMGTGYITREKGDVLTKPSFERGLLTISESDVHQTLAEAINLGHPDSGEDWEISTGLRRLPANMPNRPLWYSYPQFACLTVRDTTDKIEASNKATGPSIKDQLSNAMTKDDVERIIMGTFIDEMRKMLHLSDDYDITPSISTDELGLDSLVAVRIRSWFLNNFQVNIPALRILQGAPLHELIQQALEAVPSELTPKISSDQGLEPEVQEASLSQSDTDSNEGLDTPFTSDPQTESSSVHDELDVQEKPKEAIPQGLELKRFGPLSYTHLVFLFVHELLNDKTTLNNTVMLHLSGEIRIPDLAKAVRVLAERHESLRTCITTRNGQLVQGVLESPSLILEHKRIYTKEELFNEYISLRNYAFHLGRGQMSRIIILSYSSTDHYLLMGSHHLIFDRMSNDAVMADLERTYNGQQHDFEPLQYLDYSNEQYDQFSSGSWKESIDFWRREFTAVPDPLPLHRSQISDRRPLERYAGRIIDFRINSQISGKIRQVARKYRSTPFHFHLAAFKVLLHRFLGTRDVCIGIADSCRKDDYMRMSIGPFLNMLPLRMNANAQQNFGDAIVEAREKSYSILNNAIPFEVILNELQVVRNSTHTPLAQAFMNYAENNVEGGQSFLGCRMEIMKQDTAELPYDITFTVINNTAGDMRIILNVQESLYAESDAQLIAHGYEDILQEFATTPDRQVGDEWQFRQSDLQKALTVGRGEFLLV
ncbi:MAG: hypothetical protein Q9214_004936 [Letrouitia sp. 1 TL-2023]